MNHPTAPLPDEELTATDPDVESLADLFMDLRLDGPAEDGWTYQQTARHYARIILSRWLGGIIRPTPHPTAPLPDDELAAIYDPERLILKQDLISGLASAKRTWPTADDEWIAGYLSGWLGSYVVATELFALRAERAARARVTRDAIRDAIESVWRARAADLTTEWPPFSERSTFDEDADALWAALAPATGEGGE